MAQPMHSFNTSDLCDAYGDALQVAHSIFHNYGGRPDFHGRIVTLRVDAEFVPIRETLQMPGAGCVLVIDGGANMSIALLGDRLAEMAVNNDWAGIVINGCIRDAAGIAALPLGVKALNTCPRRPGQGNSAHRDIEVTFAGVVFTPGEYLYADQDGLVGSTTACEPPPG